MTQCFSDLFSKDKSLKKLLKEIDNYEDVMQAAYARLNHFEGLPVPFTLKCETRSTQTRRAGNNAFYDDLFNVALSLYNIAIMQAPNGSIALAQAYSNRSTLLSKLSKIEECLKDIEMSLDIPNIRSDFKNKLLERQRNYHNQKKQFKTKHDHNVVPTLPKSLLDRFFKISGRVNKKIPCASDAIEVIGNSVFAARDIKAGEVISVETAFASSLMNTEVPLCCHYCHKFSFNLIPCEFCCYTMFCDEKCRKESWEEFHIVECEIYRTCVTSISRFRLSVQAVTKALVIYNNDVNKLMAAFKEAEKCAGYIEGSDCRTQYQNLCTKPNYIQLPRRGLLFECTIAAVLIVQKMTHALSLSPLNKKERKKVIGFLGKQFICHAQESSHLGISGCVKPHNEKLFCTFSTLPDKSIGLFPFTRMFQHSCDSNAETFGLFKEKLVVAIRNIPKGTEVTIPYWTHYTNTRTFERKRYLYMNFGFICKCNACINFCESTDTEPRPSELTTTQIQIINKVENMHEFIRKRKEDIQSGSLDSSQINFIVQGLAEFSNFPNSNLYKVFLDLFQCNYSKMQSTVARQFCVGVVDPNKINT